jgi:hypothetical protein
MPTSRRATNNRARAKAIMCALSLMFKFHILSFVLLAAVDKLHYVLFSMIYLKCREL